ncbi:MAG: porin family protein [Rickettsiales bacterium]|nr:porin family protein [Rickettsiales bacterium]
MKKLLITTSILATLVTSSGFAKTEGNIVGVNLLRASATNEYQVTDATASNYAPFKDSSVGFGASYKYAINFDKIFVAPGVFFDQLSLKAKDQDDDTVSASHRYGAKVDVGYDITDNFSAYVTGGLANVSYKVDWKSANQKKSGSQASLIAGLGVAYKVTENVTLGFEYNTQSPTFKTPDNGGINEVKSKIQVAQIGVAYNF